MQVADPFKRLPGRDFRFVVAQTFMYLFDKGDVLQDGEVGEQGCFKPYRRGNLFVKRIVVVVECLKIFKQSYSNRSSNDSTSTEKMATKSLTMPLSTEMGMAVRALPVFSPL